jgi:CRP-like cAMP-binding protein
MTSNLQAGLTLEKDMLTSTVASRNDLLSHLFSSPAIKDSLLPDLRLVSLTTNQVLYEQGDRIDTAYFPVDSVVSGLAIMEDGTTVETAMLGREALVGISTLLGSGLSRQWIWTTISGNAVALDTRILERMFVQNEHALRAFLSCYRRLITQVSQRCVCNTRHTILERLCCWLLMIHDRVGGDNLKLTQEMIASRLGARRAGITVAAGMLQEMHGIEYRRGQLHIRNREVLEQVVCECYNIMRAQTNKLNTHNYSTFSL